MSNHYHTHPTVAFLATITAAFFALFAGTTTARAQGGIPPGWHADPPVIAVPIQPAVPGSPVSAPFSPANVNGAYGITGLPLPNPTGAGVTIAIVDAYGDTDSSLVDHIQGDLQQFSSHFSLPYTGPGAGQTLTEAMPNGSPTTYDSHWNLETALDVEWVHAVAPDAKILLVINTDSNSGLYSCIDYAAARAPIVSMSWGGSEFVGEAGFGDSAHFGVAGVCYFASTGDSGLGTEYPSVSPNVTAVGGTSITIGTGDTYSSEIGWSGSGGGVSTQEPFASFQTPWIVSGNRQVPDIAAIADPNTGVYVVQDGGAWEVGGTSLACPVWAAIVGLMDANLLSTIGESTLHTMLYDFGNSTNIDTYFHDITSGNNGVNATAGYDQVTGIGTPNVGVLLPAIVPTPPASPNATAGSLQATISWSASAIASSYNLYRGTSPGGESATPIKTGLTGTQVTDTGLTNGQAYYYKVAAVTAYCTSLLSTETSVTPAGSTAFYVGEDTGTQGSWKGLYGDAGFNVINDPSGNNPTYPGGVSVTTTAHNSGVWASSSIAANALSRAAAGAADRTLGVWYNTTWSMTVNTTSTETTSLYLCDINNSGFAETITVKDEHGNLLDTRSASGFQGGVYFNWNLNGHVTFTFTPTSGHWAILNGFFFTSGSGPGVPNPPTNLTATTYGNSVGLSWSASSGATSYNIYRGTTAGGESMTPIATGIAGTTYTNTGLTAGTTYYYQVVAVNAIGGSPGSIEASATASTTSASFLLVDTTTQGSWKGGYGADGWNVMQDTSGNNPSYPSYAVVTPGAHNTSTWATSSLAAPCLEKAAIGSITRFAGVWYQTSWTMNVKMSSSHQLALYLLDFANSGDAETITIKNESGVVLSTESASNFGNGVYYVWNVNGNVTITLTPTAGHWAVLSGIFFGAGNGQSTPAAPTASVMPFGKKAVLNWNKPTSATSFNIYRSTTPGGEGTTPYVSGLTGTTYTNTGLTAGTTYYYKVVAVNPVGGSPASNEVSAAATTTTASFAGTDTSTQGGWKGHYGSAGWNVFQDPSGNNPTYPSWLIFTPGSHYTSTWSASSTAANCLQKSALNSVDRVAGVWYQTAWSMTMSVSGQHNISLYLLDIANSGDAETITVKDENGAVLSTQPASNFAGGVYYTWSVNGNVTITLTPTAGHWAVLSGLFFD